MQNSSDGTVFAQGSTLNWQRLLGLMAPYPILLPPLSFHRHHSLMHTQFQLRSAFHMVKLTVHVYLAYILSVIP
jgi:hypothetical protein